MLSINPSFLYCVIRKGGCGVPPVVKQEDVNKREGKSQVKDTVKADLLEAESSCTNIIVLYVYDKNPVYFISTSTDIKT